VRILLGVLLVVAGGLKAHQLATEPVVTNGIQWLRALLILEMELEIAFGFWLIVGLLPRTTWLAAVGCFTVFCGVTLYKGIGGQTSCGCFGRLSVNPWYTLVLDVIAVAALLWRRPTSGRVASPVGRWRVRLGCVAGLALVCGVPAGLAAAMYEPARLSEDGQIIGDGRIVLLEPEQWVDKRWPLARYVDAGKAELSTGKWITVMYRHNCPHCKEELPQFTKNSRRFGRQRGIADDRVVMIELPPYAPEGKSLVPDDWTCQRARLSEDRDWFVETPVAVSLEDGAVTGVLANAPGEGEEDILSSEGLAPLDKVRTVVLKDGAYDYGFVEAGKTRVVLLHIANPYDKPVTVRKVISECKCMKASVAKSNVAGGDVIEVKLVLKAPKKRMRYNQRFLLKTDGPGGGAIPVRVKANIAMPLAIRPGKVDFGIVETGREHRREVLLVNRGAKPIALLYATCDESGKGLGRAGLPPESIPAFGELSLPVFVTPKAPGKRRFSLRISTGHAIQPSFAIGVTFDAKTP
jgi:hypothetical protein